MSTHTLTLALALMCAPNDPLPRWSEALIVIGDQRFPLAVSASPGTAPVAVQREVPAAWLTDGARVVDVLELEGTPPLLVALLARGEQSEFDVAPRVAPSAPRREIVGGPAAAAPAWRLELELLSDIGADGAWVMAPRVPHRATGHLAHLVRLQSDVLVLGGERGHLLRLDPRTGAVRMRLDAPWELERGFVGPSVWSTELCRFGDTGQAFAGNDPAALAAQRARYEARVLGWVVGGPVVSGDRIFVALAHAAPGDWTYQRAECSLLEISEHFQPLTLTQLPLPIAPVAFAPPGGGIVWALRGDGLARFDPLAPGDMYGMGPGSHDRRGELRWLSTKGAEAPQYFLQMDRAGDPVLFHDGLALRSFGPYVPRGDHARVHLPFDVVDLATGARRRIELQVPLDAEAQKPETNYSGTGESFIVFGARLVGLVDLQVVETKAEGAQHGERLVLTLQDSQRSVELWAPASLLPALR